VKTYSHHFASYTHDVSDKARQYACGLMQAGSRKNMDRMSEIIPDAKSRNLDDLLGDVDNACLLIDESSFKKQGCMSVVKDKR
jgi:hypothetical protein